MTRKLAILDDYQRVALDLADWSSLPGEVEITVFDDNLPDLEAVAARLRVPARDAARNRRRCAAR